MSQNYYVMNKVNKIIPNISLADSVFQSLNHCRMTALTVHYFKR